MQKKVRNYMAEFHMVDRGDCILTAVSGGADSLCLLLVLSALAQELEIRLCAVHVEHGIRGGESLRDAEFVENFCRQRGIPCKVFRCRALEYAREKKLTAEEGARELRYQFFYQAAEEFGADKIAVAHNQNDCAETMLFHLARGTGLKGLCGIPPVRGQIIRPLLCADRQEIEAYLRMQGQEFCQDQTNQELLYARNKIRLQVLPVLCQINEKAVAHMNQTASFAAEAQELLEELTMEASKKHFYQRDGGLVILQTLLRERPVIQRAALYEALARAAGGKRDLAKIHVGQLLALFERQSGKELSLPGGVLARRVYEGVLLESEEEQGQKSRWEYEKPFLLSQTGTVRIEHYGYEITTRVLEKNPQIEEIPKKMYTKWLDYDKIKGTMRLRIRQEQDFLIIDAQGRRKKLKKYFIDEKIPKFQRDRVLLLADDTHILWVLGYRISEDVKVTKDTKRILEIQVSGGKAYE